MEQQLEYKWSLTFRLDHWVRVVAFVVLAFTGFYIYRPFLPGGAADGFAVMAWMRFSHFVAAYILILGLVVRLYLAFFSRFSPDWRDFGMAVNLRNIRDTIAYYLLIKDRHLIYPRYNPLQALTYLFWAVLIGFMALTGFAVYHGNAFGLIPAPESFQWVNALFGGASYTRLWHYLGMWVFLITVAVHIYLSILATWVSRDRTFSSMLTGYKLKEREQQEGGK